MKLDLTGNNVMVDLETMGNGSNSAIIAIGAVRFTHDGILSRFYEVVDLGDSMLNGLSVDASTIAWWMKQSDDARKQFDCAGIKLSVALGNFQAWICDDATIWGNGATFDNVILANAYKACGMPVPWRFWNDRCYRTVKNMAHDIVYANDGTAHHALHDAEAQARHLIDIAAAWRM